MLLLMYYLCILMLLMAGKPRRQPTPRVNRSSSESLRILASLIAQFHIRKINYEKNAKDHATDFGDINNGQNLS